MNSTNKTIKFVWCVFCLLKHGNCYSWDSKKFISLCWPLLTRENKPSDDSVNRSNNLMWQRFFWKWIWSYHRVRNKLATLTELDNDDEDLVIWSINTQSNKQEREDNDALILEIFCFQLINVECCSIGSVYFIVIT